METFSALLALCAGNSPVTGEFPAQRPVTRSFDFFYDLRLEKTIENTVVILVIWDAIAPIIHHNVSVMHKTIFDNWETNQVVLPKVIPRGKIFGYAQEI